MSSHISPPIPNEISPPPSTPVTNRVACERCWRRKQRCDRLLPTCTQCTEAKAVCEQRLAFVAASDTQGRPELSVPSGQGYIGTLKRRIEHLESLAKDKRVHTTYGEAVRSLSPHHHNDIGGSLSSMQCEHNNSPSQLSNLGRVSEDSGGTTMQHARGEFDHLVLSSLAADSSTSDITSPANKLSLVHMIRSTLNMTIASMHKPDIEASEVASLVDRYVGHVLHRYPFMSSVEFRGILKNFTSGVPSTGQAFLIYMALATVERGARASQCHNHATTALLDDVLRGTPLTIMRSLIAMVLCALYNTKMGSYWHLLGIAIGKAISIGLHRLDAASTTTDSPPNDHEDHQRLFWALFVLDRQASSACCQPMALKMQDIVTPVFRQNRLGSHSGNRDAVVLLESVEHAQVLSFFRHKQDSMSTLYFSSIVSYWRDGNSLVAAEASPADRQLFAWLDVQLMLVLNQYVYDHRHEAVQQSVLGFENDIVEQTVKASHGWLEGYMDRVDEGIAMPCAIDPLLIATASIVCERIKLELTEHNAELEQLCKEVQILSLSLLSTLSERFTQAKDLRKALMLLDRTKALRRQSSNGQPNSAMQSLHEWEQSKSIPRGLRKMLLQALALSEDSTT